MWPDFCAGRGFNHVRFDKMHDYVVNLDKGERIVLAYTMRMDPGNIERLPHTSTLGVSCIHMRLDSVTLWGGRCGSSPY